MDEKRYAMVLKNRVIDIEIGIRPPEWGPDPEGNPVMAISCGEEVFIGMGYDFEKEEFGEYIPPLPSPVDPTPEPTDTELIMQTLFDSELRDFEGTEERALLAQQMTDIELAILGGYTS